MLSAANVRRQRGFSMIEVAITMAMLAVLLFAVMPEVTTMVANNRIRAGAESLLQGLQRARNEALRSNQSVTFWLATPNASGSLDNTCALSATARGWVVSLNDPTTKCAAASTSGADPFVVEKAVGGEVASTVTVSALQADTVTAANSVAFDGFGRVTGAAPISTITLNNSTNGNNFRRLQIEIQSGGSARLCQWGVVDATDPRRCFIALP